MEYQWKAPEYSRGDTVSFLGHARGGRDNPLLKGIIMRISTGYDKDKIAYHSYEIEVLGWSRRQHVGEESITGTLSP